MNIAFGGMHFVYSSGDAHSMRRSKGCHHFSSGYVVALTLALVVVPKSDTTYDAMRKYVSYIYRNDFEPLARHQNDRPRYLHI
jgi:hypothetical protein